MKREKELVMGLDLETWVALFLLLTVFNGVAVAGQPLETRKEIHHVLRTLAREDKRGWVFIHPLITMLVSAGVLTLVMNAVESTAPIKVVIVFAGAAVAVLIQFLRLERKIKARYKY